MAPDTIKSYAALGLEPGSSAERIRDAYVKLVQTLNPMLKTDDPELLLHFEKRLKEIDEAYITLRAFLPELQSLHKGEVAQKPAARLTRDYQESIVKSHTEASKTLLTLLMLLAISALGAVAYYVYVYGRQVTPTSGQVEPVVPE